MIMASFNKKLELTLDYWIKIEDVCFFKKMENILLMV